MLDRNCINLLAALLLIIGTSNASSAQGNRPTPYDTPAKTEKVRVKSDLVDEGGGLVCETYGQFMVKALNSGSPAGDLSISVAPILSGLLQPVCTLTPAPGEVSIKSENNSFVGVKGDFLVTEATDPTGPGPFTVYDRHTLRPLYSDAVADEVGMGLKFVAQEGDALHIRFTRGVRGSCSVPKEGQACWTKIARDNHLPQVIASQPVPLADCIEFYRHKKEPVADLADESEITYPVDMLIPLHGPAHVLTRGKAVCGVMP